MNLLEIRAEFAQNTGRYDLVDPDDLSDTGADRHIRSGSRFLDLRWHPEPLFGYAQVEEGNMIATLRGCFLPLRVWASDGKKRWRLWKTDLEKYRLSHAKVLTGQEKGIPHNYVFGSFRRISGQEEFSGVNALTSAVETRIEQDWEKSFLLLPPPDRAITLEVQGHFYSGKLAEDTDSNFWSEEHPNILLHAAQYQLEVDMRNMSGASDWLAAITTALNDLDQVRVANDIEEMEIIA